MTVCTTPAPSRDKRIDIVLMAALAATHLAAGEGFKSIDKLKDAIKGKNTPAEGEVIQLTGDYATAEIKMVYKSEIDPAKLYKYMKDGNLTEKEFLSCISVTRKNAEEIVPPKALDKMTTAPKAQLTMNVKEKEGVVIDITKALSKLFFGDKAAA